MSGFKDKKPQGESKTPTPPVEEKAPVAKEVAKVSCLEAYTLEEITDALGTIEEAVVAFKVAEKRKNAAAELASEAEELAQAEESKVRSSKARAIYFEAQATILKNERVVLEEAAAKAQREAEEAKKAEAEKEEALAMQKEADAEKESAAKARRDAGEYEPLIGEQVKGCFLERSALDLGGVGVILRIIPLDKPGGEAVGLPEHLLIPTVKPSNGILRRSKTQ